MRKYILYLCLLQILFNSCGKDIFKNESPKNFDVVTTSSEHLGFPDIIWYHNFWYVTFRISDAHVLGTYSKIKVMKSADFKIWEECNSYEYTGYDLRDPKFSFNEATDSLYLHFHGASEKETYGQIRKNLYINYSDVIKGNILVNNKIKELKLPNEYKLDWLWHPVWNEGRLLAGGYSHDQLRLYKYNDIQELPKILKSFNIRIGETTIGIKNDEVYLLSRKKGAGVLGSSTLDILDFQWEPLFNQELGGPNFIFRNDTLFGGGRLNSTTSIFSYSLKNHRLNLLLEFPSKYPDCGYPGLYLKNRVIYGVYYTVSLYNEGFQIKTFKL